MDGYVYALHDDEQGLVKIGCSINPKLRIKTLARDNNIKGEYNFFISNKVSDYLLQEKRCHALFEGSRVGGEWFSSSFREIVDGIKIITKLPSDYSVLSEKDRARVNRIKKVNRMPQIRITNKTKKLLDEALEYHKEIARKNGDPIPSMPVILEMLVVEGIKRLREKEKSEVSNEN